MTSLMLLGLKDEGGVVGVEILNLIYKKKQWECGRNTAVLKENYGFVLKHAEFKGVLGYRHGRFCKSRNLGLTLGREVWVRDGLGRDGMRKPDEHETLAL